MDIRNEGKGTLSRGRNHVDGAPIDGAASVSGESFVVLDDIVQPQSRQAPPVSEYMDQPLGGRMSTFSYHESGSKLLGLAGNPSQMTAVLTEIWKPDTAFLGDGVNEDIPSRQGRIVDVDVDDLPFAVEDDLRKLLSVIVYKKTGFVAKTAAVDVFTWLCSLDVLLDNP